MALLRSSKYALSLNDILNNYLNNETSYTSEYPENDRTFLKLPKNEINKSINKHMKEIVPNNVFKNYIENQANSYDEYISFRRAFSYNYGAILTMNYVMGIEAYLHNYIIDLKTGTIALNDFRLKPNPSKISPYSVRLSRNILSFITKIHINSGILPAMVSTASAFSSYDLKMR